MNPPSGCRFRTRCKYAQEHLLRRRAAAAELRPGPRGRLPLPAADPRTARTADAPAMTSAGDPRWTRRLVVGQAAEAPIRGIALALDADDADTPFMGGSADRPATPAFLRASDAERDHVIDELRKEYVDGRLSHETFIFRMETALGARNHGQLDRLFTDLPPRRTRLLARLKAALLGRGRRDDDEQPDASVTPLLPQGPGLPPGGSTGPWGTRRPGPGGPADPPAAPRRPRWTFRVAAAPPLPSGVPRTVTCASPTCRCRGATPSSLAARMAGCCLTWVRTTAPGSTAGWSVSRSRCAPETWSSSARRCSSSGRDRDAPAGAPGRSTPGYSRKA